MTNRSQKITTALVVPFVVMLAQLVGCAAPEDDGAGSVSSAMTPNRGIDEKTEKQIRGFSGNGPCSSGGEWNEATKRALYGAAYTDNGLLYVGPALIPIIEETPDWGALSDLSSAEIDQVAAICSASADPRARISCAAVATRTLEEQRGGVCRNMASTLIRVLRRMGLGADALWFSINATAGHAVVIVTLPGGQTVVVDPMWEPTVCYSYTPPLLSTRAFGDSVSVVVGGIDDQTRGGDLGRPEDDPIRVARECWDGASRGVFESKRSEAKKCCDARMTTPNDVQACKNNVDTLADLSGW